MTENILALVVSFFNFLFLMVPVVILDGVSAVYLSS